MLQGLPSNKQRKILKNPNNKNSKIQGFNSNQMEMFQKKLNKSNKIKFSKIKNKILKSK